MERRHQAIPVVARGVFDGLDLFVGNYREERRIGEVRSVLDNRLKQKLDTLLERRRLDVRHRVGLGQRLSLCVEERYFSGWFRRFRNARALADAIGTVGVGAFAGTVVSAGTEDGFVVAGSMPR